MDTPTAALFDLDGTLVDSESRTRALWSAFLDRHGIDHDERLLDRFIGRRRKTPEDVALGKPAPEGHIRGAEMPGRRPQHTVVFEDSPAGVSAAKRAGAVCVAVTTTHTPAAPAAADRVVARRGEVDRPHVCEAAGRAGSGADGGKVR